MTSNLKAIHTVVFVELIVVDERRMAIFCAKRAMTRPGRRQRQALLKRPCVVRDWDLLEAVKQKQTTAR